MPKATPATIRKRYRDAFFMGLATLLPAVLTIYVLLWTYSFIDDNIATPINNALKAQLRATAAGREVAVRLFDLDPELLRPGHAGEFAAALDEAFPGWIGLGAAIVLCLAVGFFIASFLGRRLWALLEAQLLKIPVVRAIYPSAKQITDFFIQREEEKKERFSRVCYVQFPSPGQFSLGFVMADGLRGIDERQGRRHLTVFVPMSPTPVTGFVMLVPEEEVHPIDLSVDEVFRFYLTAGLVVPERHAVGEGGGAAPPALPPPTPPPSPEER
ncbi:MAG: hypothetical protein KatS3mg102_2435 [Planctomycetota bacterium]|nr:MAG: hypothetical protein KatS3mg102_2435 [Planctomycetota bacterium]